MLLMLEAPDPNRKANTSFGTPWPARVPLNNDPLGTFCRFIARLERSGARA
jgi:hypothetical protein